VPTLDESLHRVLMTAGARSAALIDAGTGMVVRAAGQAGTGLPAAAASMADEARSATWSLGQARPGGDLDQITVTTTARVQLTKVLESRHGDALLLFVDFDRALTNPALAALQVSELAPALLA
jgi:hypothetical protein